MFLERIANDWLLDAQSVFFEKPIVIALSGGVDSIALLHAFATVARQYSRESLLSVIHVNHQLHEEADKQAVFCRDFCSSLSLGCSVLTIDWSNRENKALLSSKGVEFAARRLRYALISEDAPQDALIVTAHHADDQVETFLLNAARGSGLSGLSGIKQTSQMRIGDRLLSLWRPLLARQKEELLSYAERHQLAWVEDPTNQDITLRRNLLRREIIPLLTDEWPGFTQSVVRSVNHLQDALFLLDDFTKDWLENSTQPGFLQLASVQEYSLIKQSWMIRSWLLSTGWSAPNTERFNEFIRQIVSVKSNASHVELVYQDAFRDYSQENKIIAERGVLWRVPESLDCNPIVLFNEYLSLNPQLNWVVGSIRCSGSLFAEEASVSDDYVIKALSESSLTMSSVVRLSSASFGRRRALKKLLQENQIPAWMRAYLPVLCVNGQVCWIGGLGALADNAGKSLISESELKITWFCPGVSANIDPRLGSSH